MAGRTIGHRVGKLVAGWALALVLATGLALPVWAGTPEEEILASLEAQGYHLVVRDRTWLGRIWMIVESDEVRREIVFNPGTGEILRDYAVMRFADVPKSTKSSKATPGVATLATDPGVVGVASAVDTALSDLAVRQSIESATGEGPIIMYDPLMIYPADVK